MLYRYDEMTDITGQLRPHWQKFFENFGALNPTELNHYREHVAKQIYDNGITYNVYADPKGVNRPWELDALPFIVDEQEWKNIETGLVQRAELLNDILVDVYNDQKLLSNHLIPPELIYANPYFLRSLHRLNQYNPQSHQTYLYIYAADLTRLPNGQWAVIADRTQAPSGAGYALENRIVISRTYPEVYRSCQVKLLAEFFAVLRDTLQNVAPVKIGTQPKIVILTPGPLNETYFEHAYLARYLGYTLVEAADLTVRDQRVYFKSLAGLEPVHVILRRLDDDFCDPLELRPDSALGIPGLVQAIRAGNVVVANALGSGLIETASFAGFLPAISRYLRSEDLVMPSVETLWGGEQLALDKVINNLNRYVIKPTFINATISGYPWHKHGLDPVFAGDLDPNEQCELVYFMRKFPQNYVGQERVLLSRAPIWSKSHFEPRPIVLRVYLVSDGKGSYKVMPGGLTRVAPCQESQIVSMQRGGSSKDTWIMSSTPIRPLTLLNTNNQQVKLLRATTNLSSRIAENLFWLGRYAERCEDVTRLLRAIVSRLITNDNQAVKLLINIIANYNISINFITCYKEANQQDSVASSSNKEENQHHDPIEKSSILAQIVKQIHSGSYSQLVHALYRASSTVRDRLSVDNWRVITSVIQKLNNVPHGSEVLDFLNYILGHLASMNGLEMENMTRNYGWRFLNMGRRIERALYTIDVILDLLTDPMTHHAPAQLDSLLELVDSSMTYRSRYINIPQPLPVLDLVLTDDTNPRSLIFQLNALAENLSYLPKQEENHFLTQSEKIILKPITELKTLDIYQFFGQNEKDSKARLENLAKLLREFKNVLFKLSEQIERDYFTHI